MCISDTTQGFGHAVLRGESMSISAYISFLYESEVVYAYTLLPFMLISVILSFDIL
jgi:hypothetical protein